MTENERFEVIKHSYSVLQGLVKEINKQMADGKEGIDENNLCLLIGSLYGIDEVAERIKNVFAVMKYLHQNKA